MLFKNDIKNAIFVGVLVFAIGLAGLYMLLCRPWITPAKGTIVDDTGLLVTEDISKINNVIADSNIEFHIVPNIPNRSSMDVPNDRMEIYLGIIDRGVMAVGYGNTETAIIERSFSYKLYEMKGNTSSASITNIVYSTLPYIEKMSEVEKANYDSDRLHVFLYSE